ncbi:nuclease [Phenylobacterium sp.]|jgi:endonuclease YncB( thermonuclease family)|uniref:thermonuclease family protein n=1 Tax=Phenylobacterium sp. TaxID=1871053 RepID=UPI002F92B6A3
MRPRSRSARTGYGWAAAAAALLVGLGAAAPAMADPCEAIPRRGPMPAALKPGARFSGPVVYVGDGDSLCVAIGKGKGPASWVEVRLLDYSAPEITDLARKPWPAGIAARAALERMAKGKTVQCVAAQRSYDRIGALCKLDGVSLGDRMRAAGVAEGGWGRVD